MVGMVGNLVDVETMFTLKKFLESFGSSTVISEFGNGQVDQDFLQNHTFNSTIRGIEESDLCLLIGTNPRKEAALINARIRKRYLQGEFTVANIGPNVDLTYPVEHLGVSTNVLAQVANGTHPFCSALAQAKNPIIIYGSSLFKRDDSIALLSMLQESIITYHKLMEIQIHV